MLPKPYSGDIERNTSELLIFIILQGEMDNSPGTKLELKLLLRRQTSRQSLGYLQC